jgi:hypothetical protein
MLRAMRRVYTSEGPSLGTTPGSADWGMGLTRQNDGRDKRAIDDLIKELAELRELDQRRQTHVPGSAAHDAATLEVDLRSRRLMDQFRDLKRGRDRPLEAAVEGTKPLDARQGVERYGGSRLN